MLATITLLGVTEYLCHTLPHIYVLSIVITIRSFHYSCLTTGLFSCALVPFPLTLYCLFWILHTPFGIFKVFLNPIISIYFKNIFQLFKKIVNECLHYCSLLAMQAQKYRYVNDETNNYCMYIWTG